MASLTHHQPRSRTRYAPNASRDDSTPPSRLGPSVRRVAAKTPPVESGADEGEGPAYRPRVERTGRPAPDGPLAGAGGVVGRCTSGCLAVSAAGTDAASRLPLLRSMHRCAARGGDRYACRAGRQPIELFSRQTSPQHAGGGGGIRTHEAFARRFSRPLPSTTRPPLRGPASVARPPREARVPRRDLGAGTAAGPQVRAMTSVRMYGRRTSGTTTEPSGCWYVSRRPANTRANARPEPLSVWTSSGLAPGSGR